MAEVAKANGVQFVDLFSASQQAYAKSHAPLTINGVHLTDEGYQALAPAMFRGTDRRDAPPGSETRASLETAAPGGQ